MGQAVLGFFRSVAIRNIIAFLAILFLVVIPLAFFYLSDTKKNLTDVLSAKVSVAAQRGASLLNAEEIGRISNPNFLFTPEHDRVVEVLGRIQADFDVDNAVVYRRVEAGNFVYVGDGNNSFDIGSRVMLHTVFPETLEAAIEAWMYGTSDDTRLFTSGNSQFFQINVPIKHDGKVVAVLMLNDDATVVAQAIGVRQNFIIWGVTAVMVLGTVAFWLISFMTLRPLTRLKRAALRVSAGDLDFEIPPQRGGNEIAELNQSFRAMVGDLRESRARIEEYNRTLEQKIEERTREIAGLLDNMEEGIFSITPWGDFLPGHSSATDEMVGELADGDNFYEKLALDEDDSKILRETFEMLVTSEMGLDWEDMVKFLPSEFQPEAGRWLQARYRPVNDAAGKRQQRVMVVLRDITTEKALQEDIGRTQAHQEMVVKILQNRETFEFFYEDALKLLEECKSKLSEMTTVKRAVIDDLFRTMHTIKGTAALFALTEISEKAHAAEEVLRDLREKRDSDLSDQQRKAFVRDSDGLIKLLGDAREMVLQLTGEGGFGQKTYQLSETKIENLRRNVLAKIPERTRDEIAPLLAQLTHVPTARLLKKYGTLTRQLAEKLGKQVSFTVIDPEDTELEPDFFKKLDACFLHLIRNALDHGVEGPEEREEKGKEAVARITLLSEYHNGGIKFTLADDGRGIDPKKVLEVGKKRGFVKSERAAEMSQEEIIRLLFIPGFSSAETLSDVSGRGVGLDVVKTDIYRLGGKLKVVTTLGKGTAFEFYFPSSQAVVKEARASG